MSLKLSNKPTFICVGPGRTGTTWLFDYFSKHEGVFIAPGKEIDFFNYNYENGNSWYEDLFATDLECRGEISNNYFLEEKTIKRIASDYPEVKIIFSIREPISLLKSIYDFGIRRGIDFNDINSFLDYPYLKIMGASYNYSKEDLRVSVLDTINFEKHLNFIKSHNLDYFIFDHSQLVSNKDFLIKNLCNFLNIKYLNNENFSENIINKSGTPRFKFIMTYLSPLVSFLKKIGLRRFVGILKKSNVVNKILFNNNRKSDEINHFFENIDKSFTFSYEKLANLAKKNN